jgi:pyruvate/2-oxoacid:ferredoxin oxidoreductase alpha subunit
VKLAVLDRNISHGSGGIWAQELRAALAGLPDAPQVHDFLIGLGGRDVTPESIIDVYQQTKMSERPDGARWIELRE